MIISQSQFDLFDDIKNSPVIMEKLQYYTYAQNLYAALCNNEFQKKDTWEILNDFTYSVSWRTAGGHIAALRGIGEQYTDFYCSGIGALGDLHECDEKPEGFISDEIMMDLELIGWYPKNYNKNMFAKDI